jgi:tRNA pseudouridine55 synthase
VHLVINVDKPKGITSQEAVTKVKRLFRARKAGHAGTLDPIATGVLLVCLNEATKITRFLSDLDKEYVATLKLGERTDTLDAEGKVIEKVEDFSVSEEQIRNVLEGFKGIISQKPPMYSALKVQGKPLYKLARKGHVLERPERTVRIEELSVLRYEPPFLELRVSCSKGTYIRSLGDDIGRALGVGAHITELRRTRTGSFRAEDSARLEELPDKGESRHSVDSSLGHLEEVVLSGGDLTRALHGNPVPCHEPGRFSPDEYVRLKDREGRLFAIGRASGDRIRVERLLYIDEA